MDVDFKAIYDSAATPNDAWRSLIAQLEAANGGRVIIPPGIYEGGTRDGRDDGSEGWDFPSNTHFVGVPGLSVLVQSRVADSDQRTTGIIQIKAAADDKQNLSFDGLAFRGVYDRVSMPRDNTPAQERDIYFYNAGIQVGRHGNPGTISNVRISNCDFSGWEGCGIRAEHVRGLTTQCNRISDVGVGGILCFSVSDTHCCRDHIERLLVGRTWAKNMYGITFTSFGGQPRSRNCSASRCYVRDAVRWKGFDTHGGHDITFSYCEAYNCFIAFGIDAGSDVHGAVAPTGTNIIGCTAIWDAGDSSIPRGPGIYHESDGNTGNGANHSFVGNTIVNHGVHLGATRPNPQRHERKLGAITLRDCSRVTVADNTIVHSKHSGIAIEGDVRQALICGNSIGHLRPFVNPGGLPDQQCGLYFLKDMGTGQHDPDLSGIFAGNTLSPDLQDFPVRAQNEGQDGLPPGFLVHGNTVA